MTYIENCYNFIKNPLTLLDDWADQHKGIDSAPSNESLKEKMKYYSQLFLSDYCEDSPGFSNILAHHQNMSLNPGKYYEAVKEGKVSLLQACFDTLIIHPLISLVELVVHVVAEVLMLILSLFTGIDDNYQKLILFEEPCAIFYRCIEAIPVVGFLAGNKVLELISSLDRYFFSENSKNDDKAQS